MGSTAADLPAAVSAYIDYLCGGSGGASMAGSAPATAPPTEGAYYTAGDAHELIEGQGWWSGGGAALLELGAGAVRVATPTQQNG